MRKLAAVIGGVLLTGTPLGVHAAAASPAAPSGVCSLPGLAGQIAGQPVATAVTGVLGTARACDSK